MAKQLSVVDTFIAQHKQQYINYCEVVIYPNGKIEYAHPSHLYKLEEIWGVPSTQWYDGGPLRDKLWATVPQTANPCYWLCGDTGCIVCWYSQAVIPLNCTKTALKSLKKLIKSGCMSNHSVIEVTIEKEIEEYRGNTQELRKFWQQRDCKEKEIQTFLYS